MSCWFTVHHFKKIFRDQKLLHCLPPISILKPLKGIESEIEQNLETFFQLDYPEYELIFSVAEAQDPVCPVVLNLLKRFPNVRAQLLIEPVEIGPNPKINNLLRAYEKASYDWVLISDSNVRATPEYLTTLASHIDKNVGLITAAVVGTSSQSMGGHLERIFLNTFYARAMVLADKAGRPCVIGKSMLFQRKVANRFGGMQVLARYLAEDFMAGEAMRRLGLKVIIANFPVNQHIGSYTLSSFWSRHLRWGRIRKAQAPSIFYLEPFLGSITSGWIGALALHSIFGYSVLLVLGLHLTVWAICDFIVIGCLGQKLKFLDPLFWLWREALSLPLWICIASGNTVQWRGRQFTLETGGILKAS